MEHLKHEARSLSWLHCLSPDGSPGLCALTGLPTLPLSRQRQTRSRRTSFLRPRPGQEQGPGALSSQKGPGCAQRQLQPQKQQLYSYPHWSWANGGVAERMPPVREWKLQEKKPQGPGSVRSTKVWPDQSLTAGQQGVLSQWPSGSISPAPLATPHTCRQIPQGSWASWGTNGTEDVSFLPLVSAPSIWYGT